MKNNSERKVDYPEWFERFWKEYPRKIGKYAAYRVYDTCKRCGYSDDEIAEEARKFAVHCKEGNISKEYIMYPSQFMRTELPPLGELKMKYAQKAMRIIAIRISARTACILAERKAYAI